jgi:hypothetical protein
MTANRNLLITQGKHGVRNSAHPAATAVTGRRRVANVAETRREAAREPVRNPKTSHTRRVRPLRYRPRTGRTAGSSGVLVAPRRGGRKQRGSIPRLATGLSGYVNVPHHFWKESLVRALWSLLVIFLVVFIVVMDANNWFFLGR